MTGIKQLLKEKPFLILDGGMSIELMEKGFDITGGTWASKVLGDPDAQDAIKYIHQDYIRSGADIITDANYSSYVPKMIDELNIS